MQTLHTVVAEFDGPGEAREAMVDLEGRGIDADDIHLVDRPATMMTKEGARGEDLAASRRFIDAYVRNGIVGAVVLAAVFIGVLALMHVEPFGTAALVGGLAGAMGGFAVIGFIGASRRMPVNVEALDTYGIDPRDVDGVAVEVRVPDAEIANTAVAVLRSHHPRAIERRAA